VGSGGQVVCASAAGARLVPGRADVGAVVGAGVGAAATAASAVGDVSLAFSIVLWCTAKGSLGSAL
jgi:hypothetical protein